MVRFGTRRTAVLVTIVLGLVAGGLVAAENYDWGPWFPASQPKVFSFRTFYAETRAAYPGPQTDMDVIRSPITSSGTFTLQAKATIHATDVLESYRLEVADDQNQDLVISSGEWALLAPANAIIENNGVTTAETSAVATDATHDGYRVVMERSDLASPIVQTILVGDVEIASE